MCRLVCWGLNLGIKHQDSWFVVLNHWSRNRLSCWTKSILQPLHGTVSNFNILGRRNKGSASSNQPGPEDCDCIPYHELCNMQCMAMIDLRRTIFRGSGIPCAHIEPRVDESIGVTTQRLVPRSCLVSRYRLRSMPGSYLIDKSSG
jgi:hypothetical protein